LFCRKIVEACEAREHGSYSKQNHQVEGSIMQAKEWTRAFGRCKPVEHVVTKQQRNIVEACEAREHGSDSKQNHQVEGSIMQAKEWTRAFGLCKPVEHVATKQQRSMECTKEN
jgi:hypothetical protein